MRVKCFAQEYKAVPQPGHEPGTLDAETSAPFIGPQRPREHFKQKRNFASTAKLPGIIYDPHKGPELHDLGYYIEVGNLSFCVFKGPIKTNKIQVNLNSISIQFIKAHLQESGTLA